MEELFGFVGLAAVCLGFTAAVAVLRRLDDKAWVDAWMIPEFVSLAAVIGFAFSIAAIGHAVISAWQAHAMTRVALEVVAAVATLTLTFLAARAISRRMAQPLKPAA